MADFKLISADSHVVEPAAAWERVQKECGERAPRIVRDPPGMRKGTWVLTEGLAPMLVSHFSMGRAVAIRENTGHLGYLGKVGGLSSAGVYKLAETKRLTENFRFEDYPGGWDPAARLRDQDEDGIEAEVLFASYARSFYPLTDEPFQRAIFRSYNAWLHEFCSYNPKRLIGLPLLSIIDIEHAVADLQEYANLGFRAVFIPTRIRDSGYYDPRFEPLWTAAEESGMVINEHTGATQGGQPRTTFGASHEADPRKQVLAPHIGVLPAQEFMGHLIFSGVFDRHPNLKVVCAEYDVGWVAHLFQMVDYWFGRRGADDAPKTVNELDPSEYLKRNIFFTFQDDRAGMLTTPAYGGDNFLWASDYPHQVTTWPYSQQRLDANCAGLDHHVKRKVGRENANKLYHLGL